MGKISLKELYKGIRLEALYKLYREGIEEKVTLEELELRLSFLLEVEG